MGTATMQMQNVKIPHPRPLIPRDEAPFPISTVMTTAMMSPMIQFAAVLA